MRIPESTIAEIQNRLDMAEVIGEYVTLQRKGGRYWGLCPFHQEKSPSFSVTPDKGVFYCFGCHKGGGLFQFVMDVEKIAFPDAVELLARRAGVEIHREEEERAGVKRDAYVELYRKVAGSLHWLLTESPQGAAALAYLESRRVSASTIEAFQLGFAPPDREWLYRFLREKSYSEEFLAKTGLFLEAQGGRRPALIAGRVTFPISSPRGEVIAFGGRALGAAQPKYLNSPETPYFRKGENLFGIDRAAPAIRQGGCFILVEGYMDVLAMHQAGMIAAVAPLGTALTEQQVRLLKRYASRGIVVFDGDDAGEKASLRAIGLLERQDLVAQVVELPRGMDPADFVKEGREAELAAAVAAPGESFPWIVRKALASNDARRPEGKEKARDFLFGFVDGVASRVRADDYMKLAADAIGAEVTAMRGDFAAWKSRQRRGPGHAAGAAAGGPAGTVPQAQGGRSAAGDADEGSAPDLFLMLAVAANQGLFSLVRNAGLALPDLDDERARALYVALEEAFRAGEDDVSRLVGRIEDPGLCALVLRRASSGEFDLNPDRLIADGVKRIRQRALRRKSDMLGAELRRLGEGASGQARGRELLAQKMQLDSELAGLAPHGGPGAA
jgi:DNA primase